MEEPKVSSNYNEDAFGNKSSTRRRANWIVRFTLVLTAAFLLPILIRMGLGLTIDLPWELVGLFGFIVLTNFTAAFAPQAFAQSKEWMAYIEKLKK